MTVGIVKDNNVIINGFDFYQLSERAQKIRKEKWNFKWIIITKKKKKKKYIQGSCCLRTHLANSFILSFVDIFVLYFFFCLFIYSTIVQNDCEQITPFPNKEKVPKQSGSKKWSHLFWGFVQGKREHLHQRLARASFTHAFSLTHSESTILLSH